MPGCAPGWYRSAVVVRADDPRGTLADFRGARLAANETGSQSGWGAMAHHVAPLSDGRPFFAGIDMTGSHAASAALVVAGRADMAAIDFVTWRLIGRFRAEAGSLRVLMLSDPTPGLPYVTAFKDQAEALAGAVERAIGGLDCGARDTLGMRGLARVAEAEYDLISDRIEAARGRGM